MEEYKELLKNFEDWVSVLYSSPSDLTNKELGLVDKMKAAMDNAANIARNYTSSTEIVEFQEARSNADKKTVDIINQIIMYNAQSNQFEQIEPNTGKTL